MTTCPICKRSDLTLRTSKFGDQIWPRHKMARLSDYDTIRHTPKHIGAELQHHVTNPDAAALWEIDCPNSGQPLD